MGATVAALFFSLFNNLMQLILPAMMAMMINTGIDDGRIGLVRLLGGAMAALSAIAIGAAVAGSYYSSKVSACFGLSLRRAIFVKVESLSQCDIDKIGTPSLITRTTNDIRQIQDMVLMMIRIIISAPIVMVGGAVMAFTLNKRLSTVMFIAIPIILVIALFVAKQVMPMFDKAQKKTDRLNLILREKLSGIRVIRAFNRSEYEDGRFRKANYDLTGLMLKINRIFAFLIPLATLLCYALVAILLKMAADQIDALDAVAEREGGLGRVILLDPAGKRFDQKMAEELSREEHLTFICVHYEGYDERIRTRVTFNVKITDEGLVTFEQDALRQVQPVDNTTANATATVLNVKSVTQLPLTGAAGTVLFTVVALLVGGAGVAVAVKSRRRTY